MTKRLRTICLGIALIGANSECRADTLLAGPGAFTCGKFASDYLKNPVMTEGVFFTWAQGYMSALNVISSTEGIRGMKFYTDLGDTINFQKAKISAYCKEHPLSDYSDAVMDLMGSLPVKPIQRK